MTVSRGQLVAKPNTIGKTTPVEEVIEPAQKIVAQYSRDAAECRELLAMLGLLPGRVEVDLSAQIELEDPRPFGKGEGA